MILLIRTDKPEAELYLYDGQEQTTRVKWPAHRELAETIHTQIKKMLDESNIPYEGLKGIVVYKGPGSFTGLRIGISVANALAYAQSIPVVAVAGEDWIIDGITEIKSGQNDKIAVPRYGSPARTTKPKK